MLQLTIIFIIDSSEEYYSFFLAHFYKSILNMSDILFTKSFSVYLSSFAAQIHLRPAAGWLGGYLHNIIIVNDHGGPHLHPQPANQNKT